jgi:type II secretory pathway pseudopilin PulG
LQNRTGDESPIRLAGVALDTLSAPGEAFGSVLIPTAGATAAEEDREGSWMQARASSGATRRRGEGGFGLIEAVVSVGLVSTVVLALAAGLLTSVKSSQAAKETQEVDAAVSAYAEAFKDPSLYAPGKLPDPCDESGYGTLVAEPPGVSSASVVGVEHWSTSPTVGWVETCTSDPGAHRLTVEVEMSGSNATATAQVVMRKP